MSHQRRLPVGERSTNSQRQPSLAQTRRRSAAPSARKWANELAIGGARLVEAIAHLRDLVARSARRTLQLVVVQAVAKDVVELGDPLGADLAGLGDIARGGVQDVPEVPEALQPALGLLWVAPQARRLGGPAAALISPCARSQSRRASASGTHVLGVAPRASSRVREGDEQLVRLVRLRGVLLPDRCHVTIIRRLDKLQATCYTTHVTDKIAMTQVTPCGARRDHRRHR